jgi:hypothetical protein
MFTCARVVDPITPPLRRLRRRTSANSASSASSAFLVVVRFSFVIFVPFVTS